MKTFTQKIIGLFLLLHTFIFSINAQEAPCVLPAPFNGNTGANMTVMLTPAIFGAFPANLVEDAYVVAVADNSGLVVGSTPVLEFLKLHLLYGEMILLPLKMTVRQQMNQSLIILLMGMNYMM